MTLYRMPFGTTSLSHRISFLNWHEFLHFYKQTKARVAWLSFSHGLSARYNRSRIGNKCVYSHLYTSRYLCIFLFLHKSDANSNWKQRGMYISRWMMITYTCTLALENMKLEFALPYCRKLYFFCFGFPFDFIQNSIPSPLFSILVCVFWFCF